MTDPFNLDAARTLIAEGQEIAAKASPGPWIEEEAYIIGTDGCNVCIVSYFNQPVTKHDGNEDWYSKADSKFIAHVRTAYPGALAMLGAACDRIAELEAVSDYQRQSNEGLVGRIAELEAERDRLGEDVMRLRAGSCPHCCGYCREFERSKVAGRP